MPHSVPGVRLLMALFLLGPMNVGRATAAEGSPSAHPPGGRAARSVQRAVFGLPSVQRAAAQQPPAPQPAPAPAPQPTTPPGAPGPAATTDPVGTPEDPLTLTEAIEAAYRNHADIAIAEDSVEAARERVTQAKTGTLPTVSGEITYTGRGVTDLGGLFGSGPEATVTDNGLQPAVRARATLFDQGQTRLRVRQARTGVRGSESGVQNVRRLLRFQVTSDYIELLRAAQQFTLAEERVRLAQAQLDLIDARIAVGDAATSDRFPVLRELRSAQEQTVRTQNNVNVSSTVLRNSMGLPAGPPPVVTELPRPTFEVPGVQESMTLADQSRPDLQQSIAAVETSRDTVSLAKIQRRPLFTTVVGANITPKEEFSRADWNFAMALTMPLWDAGLTRSRQREAEANLDSDRARLEQTRKDIAAEVQAAILNLASAQERVDASRATVEAAQVALDAANARYQQGLATTIDLTDAQLGFIVARNTDINALYDYYLAQALLERAIGR